MILAPGSYRLDCATYRYFSEEGSCQQPFVLAKLLYHMAEIGSGDKIYSGLHRR
jgi:hypothetical protein